MSGVPTVPTTIPPFQLQLLASNLYGSTQDALEAGFGTSGVTSASIGILSRASGSPPPDKAGLKDYSVRCAQGLGRDIYVGCGDGTLLRCSLQDDSSSSGDLYQVVSRQSLPNNKPVDQIALVPSVSKALVLSGNVIYFFTLPNLEPVPPALIQPIKNVITFALDELDLRKEYPPDVSERAVDPIGLCVIRKKGIALYGLRERLYAARDKLIPITVTPIVARRIGKNLCLADASVYSLIDLDASQLFEIIPVSQAPDADTTAQIKPFISVVTENEFLVLSWTGSNSLGLFINANGDPTRGTLEWPYHPLSLSIEYPYVTALLPNHTTEIHNIETLSISQILSHPHTFEPHSISHDVSGYFVPSAQTEKLRTVTIPVLPPHPPTKSEETSEPTGSGLTPPPTPQKPTSARRSSSRSLSGLTRAQTLLVGAEAVHSLLPATLLSQVESLLEEGLMKQAIELAEQTKRKNTSGGIVQEDQLAELRYVYQRLGIKCLAQTLFEEAGDNFFRGDTDPRLILRLFPDLYGALVSPSDTVKVFIGLENEFQSFTSVDEIIMANLVRNYSPHVKPDVKTASSTAELMKILDGNAREMLLRFMRKVRNHRLYSTGITPDPKLDSMIDTVLVRLYAETEQPSELESLLESSSAISINDVEATLIQHKQYSALSKLYEKAKNEAKLLEIWTKIADGMWKDKEFGDPLPRIISVLNECRDRALLQQYGYWLIKKDPAAGLKLFTAKRPMKVDDLAVLREFRKVDTEAADQFLEHVVLVKRSNNAMLHNILATRYLDILITQLQNSAISKSFSETLSSYTAPQTSASFLTYLARSTSPSEAKTIRLKLMFFLQGSDLYDLPPVRRKLDKDEAVSLNFERAIVDGKLQNHRQALTTLVNLRDSVSAETYCTLGGTLIPLRTAQSITEELGIPLWITPLAARKIEVAESKKKELLKILMEVYMSGGADLSNQTAHLLNAQAVNLDVADVLNSVPQTWSLSIISTFLSRSLRRSLHEKNEGQILKAVSWGQNIEAGERAWNLAREEGAIFEEPVEGEGDEKDGGGGGEPSSFVEEKMLPLLPPESKEGGVKEIRP